MTDHHTHDCPAGRLQELLLESEDLTDFLDVFIHTLLAQALDEIQYGFGDGPCLTAAREHRVVYVPDTLTDDLLPDYGEAAAAAGIRSALGVPLELGGEARAGLDVYADQPEAYDQATIKVIQHEVARVSHILRLAVRLAHHRDTGADLKTAMVSRTTIDLAVGITMGQNRCTQQAAIEILKAASNHRNIKLRDLAADLVATVSQGPAATHFDT